MHVIETKMPIMNIMFWNIINEYIYLCRKLE